MVAKNELKNTGSPKVDVGEIDMSSPFKSVKAAVSLFGEGASSGEKPEKPAFKKTKSYSSERVSAKETYLHLAQKKLERLEEQLTNAESLKVEALAELQTAQQTVNELTHKLKVVSESKDLEIKVTEKANIQVEVASNGVSKGNDGSSGLELETGREKYSAAITELDAAKQVLWSTRQKQMDLVKTSDLFFGGANKSLHKAAAEKNFLQTLVESLKVELDNVKRENSELKKNEAETGSISENLHAKLQKATHELQLALIGEEKIRGTSEEMISTLHQLIAESEDAKHGAEAMKQQAEELKRESESTRIVLEEAESRLRDALEEAEEAKAAETRALEQIKVLSERTTAALTSSSESGANIRISTEEFVSLNRKVEEADKLAEMKVTAAMAQVEAMKASEKETMIQQEAWQKEIDEMRAATQEALKKAEMAEVAKRAVENELKRWRQLEQMKATEAASRILADADMPMESPKSHSLQSQNQSRRTDGIMVSYPPVKFNKQKQNQPMPKPEQQKPEKRRISLSKKTLMPNLSGFFHKKKNQIQGRWSIS